MDLYKYENELYKKGIKYIAGVDEVGRGPLIGSVITACVVLPKDFDAEMTGVLVTEDSVTLDKNDGKSINSNNTTITSTLEDKYDVSEKTLSKLKDDEKNVNELDNYQYFVQIVEYF